MNVVFSERCPVPGESVPDIVVQVAEEAVPGGEAPEYGSEFLFSQGEEAGEELTFVRFGPDERREIELRWRKRLTNGCRPLPAVGSCWRGFFPDRAGSAPERISLPAQAGRTVFSHFAHAFEPRDPPPRPCPGAIRNPARTACPARSRREPPLSPAPRRSPRERRLRRCRTAGFFECLPRGRVRIARSEFRSRHPDSGSWACALPSRWY